MSIATDQEQLDYFHERVISIKRKKISEKYDIAINISGTVPYPTHGEMVQALINGSATLKNKNDDGGIYVGSLVWPEFEEKANAAKETKLQAMNNYNAYDLALSASISRIVDQVVLGKLKPLDAINQIENLA